MSKYIALDIDDTIVDFKNPMMRALNRLTGRDIHWATWDCYNLPEIYNISTTEFYDCLKNDNIISNAEPVVEAKEMCETLHASGYTILLVTARGWHPEAFRLTEAWLNDHQYKYDHLFVTNFFDSKYDAIKQFGKIDIAVDDSFKHVEDYKSSGMVDNTLLYHHPWNKNHDHDKIIYNISEVSKYMRT